MLNDDCEMTTPKGTFKGKAAILKAWEEQRKGGEAPPAFGPWDKPDKDSVSRTAKVMG
jgi:hypothetical protein